MPMRFGLQLWSQSTTWAGFRDAAVRAEAAGWDSIWTWDHLLAIFGPWEQPIFEGWTTMAGLAPLTSRVRLGLMVGANTFRNPGLTAKLAETLDHISDGRAILGIGGAWMELEHKAHGIDFGSGFGRRLDWMDEAVGAMRTVLDGDSATSSGDGRYGFDDLRHAPLPIQKKLPIMIGGSGEKKTLRFMAQHAEMANFTAGYDELPRKLEVLAGHCADAGRDIGTINKTALVSLFLGETYEAAVAKVDQRLAPMGMTWAGLEDGMRAQFSGRFVIGGPDEVGERCRQFLDLGLDGLTFNMPSDGLELDAVAFAGEVVSKAVA